MLLDVIAKGTTDYSVTIRIVDSTDGTPETGVVFNTSGIDLWYRRPGAAHSSITEATQTEGGAHTDGGFVHISDGYYRLDLPDAAAASGVDYFDVGGTVTGMVVIGGRVRLTGIDLDDGVRAGLTALPNAAADAAGGLPISDAGGLDLDGRLDAAVSSRLAPTVASRTLDVTSTGAAGLDWGNIENAGTTVDLSATSINLCDTVTTNTDMRGTDSAYTGTPPTAATIADAVLDEALSGHTTAGTLGKAVADIETDATAILADTNELQTDDVPGLIAGLNDPTAATIADAVLDEALSGHTTAGTLGKAVSDIETDATAILADTNELQVDWVNGGRLDLILDGIDTEIKKLTTTAHSEPTGVPAANEAPIDKLGYLFMALRNEVRVTSTKKTFYDDGGAAEWEKDLSDDGTTYTETEANAI